jgi:muramidase (phage lysozyme)
VGGSLFDGYADHPRQIVDIKNKDGVVVLQSSAAGRYQILEHNFDVYKKQLNLPDFGHDAQDAIAVQMIKEVKAYPMILAGQIQAAVVASSSRWASLPNAAGASAYGQPVQKMQRLVLAYQRFGGTGA